MDIKPQIAEAVESHRQEALELLQTLVRIPSLEGNEKPCQEITAEKMRALNLEIDIWDPPDDALQAHPAYVPTGKSYQGRPNVVGIRRGSGGGRSLILNGHVDVVPIGPEENWSKGPWSGHFEDGRVYGRGSADMKGGVVSNLIAVQALQTAGIQLQGDLIVECVVDEEAGGNGTLACIMRGYTGDGCIFTEPSGLGRLAVSNRGAQFFRIIVPGQEGGIEFKHELVNPITKAIEIFQAVEAYSIMRESTVSHPLYDAYWNTKVPTGICKFHVALDRRLPGRVGGQHRVPARRGYPGRQTGLSGIPYGMVSQGPLAQRAPAASGVVWPLVRFLRSPAGPSVCADPDPHRHRCHGSETFHWRRGRQRPAPARALRGHARRSVRTRRGDDPQHR